LIQQANLEDPEQRIDAVLELAEIAHDKAGADDLKFIVPVVLKQLMSRDEPQRAAAIMATERIGSKAVPYLGGVDSTEIKEFVAAAEAIRLIGEPAKEWTPNLVRRLESDDDRQLIAALEALAGIGKPSVVALEKVIPHFDSRNFHVQVACCKIVVALGPEAKPAAAKVKQLFENGIASARTWAAIALGAIGKHEDYDVIELLSQKLNAFLLVEKERALEGLALMGPEAKPALDKVVQLMEDRTKNARHYAAYTHWKITGDPDPAVKLLSQLSGTINFGVESIDILGKMGPAARDAVPTLIKRLEDEEPAPREAAVWALAEIGPAASTAIPALESLLDDEDRLIRAGAKRAIEKIQTSKDGGDDATKRN
jgi:HEAT repeat protein